MSPDEDYAADFHYELILLLQQALGIGNLRKAQTLLNDLYPAIVRTIAVEAAERLDIPAPTAASFYACAAGIEFQQVTAVLLPRWLWWIRARRRRQHEAIMRYAAPITAEYKGTDLWIRYLAAKTEMLKAIAR